MTDYAVLWHALAIIYSNCCLFFICECSQTNGNQFDHNRKRNQFFPYFHQSFTYLFWKMKVAILLFYNLTNVFPNLSARVDLLQKIDQIFLYFPGLYKYSIYINIDQIKFPVIDYTSVNVVSLNFHKFLKENIIFSRHLFKQQILKSLIIKFMSGHLNSVLILINFLLYEDCHVCRY